MTDDERMEQWLREAMEAPLPHLSPAFDDRVMRSTRPRRLTVSGRLVLGAYAIVAVIIAIWTMQELSVVLIAVATLVGALVAAGLSTYVRAVTQAGT